VGEGTGLGLFVCRRLVRGLGGDVTVHDRPGGGALFRVRLPVSDRPAVSRASEPTRPAAVGRILVVDDDSLVSGVLVGQLKDEGFTAEAILDPHQGLEVLSSEAYDLAYCDLMMAGLTGMDIARELSARAPARLARVVFMTGGAFVPRAAAFVAQHPESCVEKPFDIIAETRRRLAQAT
jgi:CheY-like chemotaxis protein